MITSVRASFEASCKEALRAQQNGEIIPFDKITPEDLQFWENVFKE